MVSARVELTEYSNKVLNIIKAKYGLHDKSEALNKFIEQYGQEVEPELKESYIQKVLKLEEDYFKKYGHNKRMSKKEFNELFGK